MSNWPKRSSVASPRRNVLHIARYRNDGATYGTPTWIWSVFRIDDAYRAKSRADEQRTRTRRHRAGRSS
jgi:hypothetical protein